jgi:histidine triad (HIT) family protein
MGSPACALRHQKEGNVSACLFCRIVEGTIPADIVFQDEQALAFRDINPQAPVHLLVIPKRHVASLQDSENEHRDLLARLLLLCKEMAHRHGLANSGYRVVTNVGRDAGQTVFHMHLHVLGGRQMSWPPG